MLEGSDFENIEQVPPFFGAIDDSHCGFESTLVTKTFTVYVKMTKSIYHEKEIHGWKIEELDDYCIRIKNTKEFAEEVFQPYRPSDMGIQNFQAFDHIPQLLKRLEGVEFAHAGPYDAANKDFKNDYRTSSRQRRLVMDHVIARQNTRLAQQKLFPTVQALQRKCSALLFHAARTHSTYLLR